MSTFKQLALCTMRASLSARLCVFSLAFAASLVSLSQAYAAPFSVSYSGRLTQSTGAPVDGPVDISVKFWNAAVSGSTLTAPVEFTAVDLNSGVFSLPLELSSEQVQQIFGDVSSPVFIEITAAGKTYPRQQYSFVPLALRIPVDGKTVAFDSNGNLGLSVRNLPAANQFLTKDGSGQLIWGTPAVAASSGGTMSMPNVGTAGTYVKVVTDAQGRVTQGLSLAAADVTAALGQSLTTAVVAESGTNLYYTDARARGVISANAPLSYSISSGQISLAQASGSANGYLSSADWTIFNAKQNALGFAPLNKAGDSMSGALNMGSSDLTNTGNISMAAAKTFLLSNNSSDPSSLTAADAGKTWFNTATNQIKYWNGSSVLALGVSGAGLTNLNGLTGNTQTFTSGTAGTSPAINSSGTVHTINVPLASAVGVTGGVISNSDYASFSSKLSGVGAGTGVSVSTISGTATVSLSSVGNAGTYAKVTTNAQGQVVAGDSLSAGDIPNLDAGKITTGQLPLANGGTGVSAFTNNGVVIGSSSALSSTAAGVQYNVFVAGSGGQPGFGQVNLGSSSAVSGVLPTANGGVGISSTPTSGQILVGNGTGYSLGSVSQGATQGVSVTSSGSGVVLDTVQDIRTSATPNFAGLTVSGVAANSLLKTNGSKAFTAAGSSDVISALGFTPLSKAGDSMSGTLNMNGQPITNAGNVTISTAKTLGLGIFDNTAEATLVTSLDSTGAMSPDKGKTWFNSSTSQVKYWTGSTAQALGVSGAGLTNLNGLTVSTQSFATGTSGNSPLFSSTGSVHTLNIPLASAAGVTAGVISNSDYSSFSGKLSGV
ncbi:MAG: hypothetical protein NTY08_00160, partial [Proteobacteria bacterium]|nr:hypothetical protein [Pseudomonadota bacterium]